MASLPKYLSSICLVSLCLFLVACTSVAGVEHQPPQAVEGILDLRMWDFAQDGAINLSGEWNFYWNELLTPDQLISQSPTAYVPVPDVWTNYVIANTTLPPKGFATYHLTLLYPPETTQTFGLYIEGEGSAYALWVDGQLAAQIGRVGVTPEAMTPEKKPITIFFEPHGETVELVLQISNFQHRKGGFRNEPLLGLAEPVHRYQLQNWFLEAFSAGILFVMGLYHLFLYLFRTKDKAPLYFALLCWSTAVRTGVTNQSTLLFFFPIGWELALRLEYLVFFLSPILFVLFLQSLYPRDIHRWFVWAVLGCGVGFSLFLIVSDTFLLSYSSTYYQVIYVLEIIYCGYFLTRIMHKRRTGAFYIGFASLILFATIIYDTLFQIEVIGAIQFSQTVPIENVSSFGFVAFIFVQSLLLASLFSQSFSNIEILSGELEETNLSLEKSERKYRTLFENSKDMIFIAGVDGQIQDVSPACQAVLGFTKSEMVQMTMYDVIVDPVDSERFREAIISQGAVTNLESDLLCKDGQVIHTLVSATPRVDENGRIIDVQGSVRDITARKQAETERLRALKLEQIASTDPLTKVNNRRFFDQVVLKEIERAKRENAYLALILFDIDYFKEVNDSFGHLTGDEVLVKLAVLCQQTIRSMDFLARFGGEEFVVLLPDMNGESAQAVAENLRQLIAQTPLTVANETSLSVTVSMGVAIWHASDPIAVNVLLERADQALYQSKDVGRNQVTLWREG